MHFALFYTWAVCCVTGLGQARLMPGGVHAQERDLKHEQHLLGLLANISLDSALVAIVKKQARALLQGTPLPLPRLSHPFRPKLCPPPV